MPGNYKVFVSFTVAFVVFLLAALPVAADEPCQYSGCTQKSPEEEYHRAIYDLCYFYMSYGARASKELGRAQDACNIFTEWIRESGRYEKRSPGWQRVIEVKPAWQRET